MHSSHLCSCDSKQKVPWGGGGFCQDRAVGDREGGGCRVAILIWVRAVLPGGPLTVGSRCQGRWENKIGRAVGGQVGGSALQKESISARWVGSRAVAQNPRRRWQAVGR